MDSRRRPTTTLVLASLLCLYHAPRGAYSFSLDFSDSGAGSLIILAGDALIRPPTLQLTKNSQASYRYKVPLWNGATGEMASFATAFSFRITLEKDSLPRIAGDGMIFFLAHFPSVPLDSTNGLGLLPVFADGTCESRVVAVEFAALLNHVGIDVSSANSTTPSAHATMTWPGKNLTSPYVMEAIVKYHNDTKLLAVDLLIGDALYQLNATVDLRRVLPEEVAVGFSMGNGAGAGLHRILSWSFSSSLPESKWEAPPPAEPPLPTRSYSRKKIALVLLFLGTITTRCVRIGFQFRFKTSPGHVALPVLA